jgi:hypothetical protein
MSRSRGRDEEKFEGSDLGTALSRGGGGTRPRIAAEPEPENRFGDNRRVRLIFQAREYRIRPSELAVLTELGRFRLIREDDLIKGEYAGDGRLAQADFRSLRQQKLIQSISFQGLQGGPGRVHTLTGEGYNLIVLNRQTPEKFFYFGAYKAAQAEHDSLIYRAFVRERDRIHKEGGTVKRIVMESDFARVHFARVYKREKGTYWEAQKESANELHLSVMNGHVVFPDFRLEYEDHRGDMARVDVEVATGNYRDKHMGMKVAAGFRIYAESGAGRLGVESGNAKGITFPRQKRSIFSL